MKKILITAGATQVPIDKVRAITNIFEGKTGATIAQYLAKHDFEVVLLTSRPDLVNEGQKLKIIKYRTFDELLVTMKSLLAGGGFDVVIHSAAVSDYDVAGIYLKEGNDLIEIDRAGKISSDVSEYYLKLKQTPKIINLIRGWGFKGFLIKFKLQVGMSDEELIKIATASMHHSQADAIIANCLEWYKQYAYLIAGIDDSVKRVTREHLPEAIAKIINEAQKNE